MVFNLFWRLRYLFVTDVAIGAHDVAVIITTLLYGGVAMVALVIGSVWLTQKTAAARLATTALGVSAGIAGVLVWLAGVGRDVDAFHGIAENTSTAAVGYEGYLAWAAAAAIVAPTTLYAVFLVKPPTMAVYRGAALKCLTLIAFWTFAAAGLRVTDYLIALWLDLPRSIYDTFALLAFNVATGCIAVWLQRQLAKGGLSSVVIAAFSGSLFVFTAAQLVIGVALAPRYADPTPRSPDAIYGNDLAQQITSMFDVVICALSLAILVAVVVTGPLAGYLTWRRAAPPHRCPPSAPAAPAPRPGAAPTVVHGRSRPRCRRSFGSNRIRRVCSPRPLRSSRPRMPRRRPRRYRSPRPRCGSSGGRTRPPMATEATEHIPTHQPPEPTPETSRRVRARHHERRADRVRHERVGQRGGQPVLRPPARAVRGHQHVGRHVAERGDGGFDDRLESRSGEVEAAEQRVQPVDAGQPQRVPGDVDRAGVAAAGDHDQAPAADVDDQRLLVEDQRVGLPPPVAPRLVVGHAALEVGRAVHLAGDEHAAVEQQRRLRAARSPRSPRPPAPRGSASAAPTARLAGQRDPAPGPHQRMHGERQTAAAAQLGQPGQPAGVIEVSVAEHHAPRCRPRRARAGRSCRPCRPGDTPVSNSTVCVVSPRRVVTSAEKPCSATSPGCVRPSSNCGASTVGILPLRARRAAPMSPISPS